MVVTASAHDANAGCRQPLLEPSPRGRLGRLETEWLVVFAFFCEDRVRGREAGVISDFGGTHIGEEQQIGAGLMGGAPDRGDDVLVGATEREDLVAVPADAARDVEGEVPGGNVDRRAVLANERPFESKALLERFEFATCLARTQDEWDVVFAKYMERLEGCI